MFGQLTSPQAKLDMVRVIGRMTFAVNPNELEQLEQTFSFLDNRLRYRNQLAHGVYLIHKETDALYIARRKHGAEDPKSFRILPTSELKQELKQLLEASIRLQKLFELINPTIYLGSPHSILPNDQST